MKGLKTLLGALAVVSLLGFSFSANAQENGNRDENGNVVRGAYETNNKLFDNTFLGLGAGVNTVYNDKEIGNYALGTDVYLGKWFTPTVGGRIGWHGLKNEIKGNENAIDQFHYAHADFLWNFSNAVSGYKETRVWDIIPFVGFGDLMTVPANGTFADNVNHEYAGSAGIINNFRLGSRVDLNLEIGALLARGAAYRTPDRFIGFPYASLGLAFNLGRTNFDRHSSVIPAVVPMPFTVDQYNALKDKVAQLEKENAALKNRIAQLESRKPDTVYVENDAVATPAALYFDLGKAKLSQRELAHLEYFATNALDSDSKVTVTGSADKQTGSHDYNQKLSEKRANYVKDLLVSKYGLSENNITVVAEGDTNNVFDTPAKNRVVTIKK